MAHSRNALANGALIAAFGVALVFGGCGIAGTDVEINAPILNAVGVNLSSKPKSEEDLPERPGLVMPPSGATAKLPAPGDHTAAAQNWPVDPDLTKKQKADAEAAAREKYCREGDWSGKAGIGEFEKNVGREARCPSKLGDALSKSLGGGPATTKQ
jgi:hypothetical protein